MSKINNLLVERYRPASLDGYVFSSEQTSYTVGKWIRQQGIPHVLLTGGPGTGKSTLAQILINEIGIEPVDTIKVNASTMGVGYITETLVPWMRKSTISSPFKVVFLDEADRISHAGQKVLLNIIEDYSEYVRFIATANYANKIIPALHSRFQHLVVDDMDKEDVIDRVADVVEQEELDFGEPEDLMSHIDAFYPDMRKILNSIDQHTDEDRLIHPLTGKGNGSEDSDAWAAIWEAEGDLDLQAALNLVPLVDESNFDDFYRIMYENSSAFPDETKGITLLSEYLDRAMRSANQALHLKAFLYHAFLMGGDDE